MNRLPRHFFTADNMFGDEVAADARGFVGPDEMNEAMIDRWNCAVGENDLVWVLGDFHTVNRLPTPSLLRELHGVKYLVAGPLDSVFSPNAGSEKNLLTRTRFHREQIGFKAVVTGAGIARKTGRPLMLPLRLRADNLPQPVILSHFPYDATESERGQPDRFAQWRPKRGSGWLLHGHQAEWVVQGTQINVSADVWDLEPVGADVVIGLIEGAS